jgi:DNA-directed RNA polymerase specialized sigma subunit
MSPHLQLDPHADLTGKNAENQVMERDIYAIRNGDWTAKNHLARMFHPLIHALAEKRAHGNTPEMNRLMSLGRDGLLKAARKYTPKIGPAHFRVFALGFIEAAMDGKRGFWQRLFGR